MHTIYTGERVKLRPFESKDEYLGLWDRVHSGTNEHWGPRWEPRGERAGDFDGNGMLDTGNYGMFAIDRLDTGELIGYEEHGGRSTGEIYNWFGTYILPEHWHNGFGIEAKQLLLCYLFENYPFERIETVTLAHHERACKGLVASGLHYEGAIRGYHYADGRYWDRVGYVIFREEWERLPIRDVVQRGRPCR